jgi:C-terminal processing protease CtpA/Prc
MGTFIAELVLAFLKKSLMLHYIFLPGDEILAVNGKALHGLSHQEAIAVFKEIRAGQVVLHVGRRVPKRRREALLRPHI